MKQSFRMIDVSEKSVTRRRAVARGSIRLNPGLLEMAAKGESPKGNILAMAEVAGILAAKRTPDLLPLCHHLQVDSVKVWFELNAASVDAYCEVVCHGKTGVEMEALVGVNTALLTIYDLAKAVDPVIEITDVHLMTKEGGKSGLWVHPRTASAARPGAGVDEMGRNFENLRVVVGTLSDRASRGQYEDESGPLLREYCRARGGIEVAYRVTPDEPDQIRNLIVEAREKGADVLLLTGGTGISPRDVTPEVLREMAEKELTGFGEAQRHYGARFTKAAWLSRSSAFVVQGMLVVLFPGSPKAVEQGLDGVGELIPHAVRMAKGQNRH